ncbi:hypothetical protein AB1Y20_007309 [Prymnesium parvum]|uniref:Uncharacterized protein n=1 Tax=Prymnesium parvum TaxID=97485 RepID=A0AB34IX89_PRYPA
MPTAAARPDGSSERRERPIRIPPRIQLVLYARGGERMRGKHGMRTSTRARPHSERMLPERTLPGWAFAASCRSLMPLAAHGRCSMAPAVAIASSLTPQNQPH